MSRPPPGCDGAAQILLCSNPCSKSCACPAVISHDLNLVRSIAQRVCVMQAGNCRAGRLQTLFMPATPYSRLCWMPNRRYRLSGSAREGCSRRPECALPLGGGLSEQAVPAAVDASACTATGKTLGIAASRLRQVHPGQAICVCSIQRQLRPRARPRASAETDAPGASRFRWYPGPYGSLSRACRCSRSSAKAWKYRAMQPRSVTPR